MWKESCVARKGFTPGCGGILLLILVDWELADVLLPDPVVVIRACLFAELVLVWGVCVWVWGV